MRNLIIIVFFFLSSSNYIYAQWATDPNNNLIVGYGLDPHICSDSAGGCYITYDYNSTSYPRWLALERLDKYGYKPWGTLKRILGELPGQSKAEITENGEGGVIISYEDRDETVGWTARIRVQKVDSNGNFLWGPTGVKVTLDEINQGSQKIVNDGEGGAVVIWVNTIAEYKVNRISSDGQRMWGDSGIVLGVNSSYDPAILARTSNNNYVSSTERNIIKYFDENGNVFYTDSAVFGLGNIISDGIGGIVLSGRVWTGIIPKLVAQRKDSLGNNLWQEPYVEIADSLGLGSFRVGANNRIINYAWLGTYNGQTDRPCFQAVNLEGNLVYQNKILLGEYPSGTTFIGIISSYYNNTIFSWSVSGEVNSIFAQMYDTLGNKIWNENGIIVSHPRMTYQQYSTDGSGGFIVVGLINNFTVVAQQVNKYGKLGEIITNISSEENKVIENELTLIQNFPNPFNSSSTIQYIVPADEDILIELFNTLGEKVKTLVNRFHTQGVYTVNLSSNELSSGIYLYKLQTETKSLTKKLIIIK